MEENEIVSGMYLATKDGNTYTNGVVIEVDGNEVVVLSDFGNFINLTLEQLNEHYTPSKGWLMSKKWNYPLPTTVERISEQIFKLECAKRQLLGKVI